MLAIQVRGDSVTDRMGKLDRLLALIHALAESIDGLTLDDMADRLGVNRRTAERMRDVIARHFDLDVRIDDRHKRFFIRDSLRRVYTRPNAAEVAALQAEADAWKERGQTARASPLESLLGKVKGALDDREKRRLDPDLDALLRLQRAFVPAGPSVQADPAALVAVQGAILAGTCLEFDYSTEGRSEPEWRRVIPYGLVHGSLTYLVGKMPDRDAPPVYYRLDRMENVRASNITGCAPEDFDLDAWLATSFGIWRDGEHDVVLHISGQSAERARHWRFHPSQNLHENGDDSLTVSFRAGGLRELAEHIFIWGGDIRIAAPDALRTVMRERLDAAARALDGRPFLSSSPQMPKS